MRQLAFVVGLVACLSTPSVAAAADAAPVACDRFFDGAPPDVECFEIAVPEWHDGRNTTTLTLAVAVLRSTGANPAPDPVVYLAGGPGGSAISSINLWAASPLRRGRDIILVDQRGTLFASPFLDCPEQLSAERYVGAVPVTPDEHVDALATASVACGDRLEADGIDLAAYSTQASADDLDLVRVALGIERWNLYGVSYGTRLGLEILRRHPGGVRSAVLDGLYPPDVDPYRSLAANHERAIGDFFEACRTDPACVGNYGELEATFWALVEEYNALPRSLGIPAPGGDVAGILTGDMLITQLVGALSSNVTLPWAPAQIAALAEGNLAQYELSNPFVTDDLSGGVRLSIECAERLATIGPDELAAAAARDHPRLATYAARYAEPASCATWPVEAVDPAQLEPVISDVPIMLVSGELDPLTPPQWAEHAAETLPGSVSVVVARGGHGASLANACMGAVVAAFVESPDRVPDAGCAGEPAAFRTDVALSSALPRALVSARSTVSPPPIAGLVAIALVMVAWLVGAAWTRRTRSVPWWIATATALAVILVPAGVAILVTRIAAGPEADILLLGLPGWAGWVLLLPWLIGTLVVAAAAAATVAWIRRRGPRLERIGMAAVALAGVGAVAVLAAYGFLTVG